MSLHSLSGSVDSHLQRGASDAQHRGGRGSIQLADRDQQERFSFRLAELGERAVGGAQGSVANRPGLGVGARSGRVLGDQLERCQASVLSLSTCQASARDDEGEGRGLVRRPMGAPSLDERGQCILRGFLGQPRVTAPASAVAQKARCELGQGTVEGKVVAEVIAEGVFLAHTSSVPAGVERSQVG